MKRTLVICDGLHGHYLPAAGLNWQKFNWTQINKHLDPDGRPNTDLCPECSVATFIAAMMMIFHGWENFGIKTKIFPEGLTYEITQEAGKTNGFMNANEIMGC